MRRTRAHVRWTMLGVAVALALAAMPAAANVQLSEATLRATASGLTFRGSEGTLSVACALTLTGTLRREIPLAERSVIGEITTARAVDAPGGR